jgi:hypothetical protein
MEHIIELIMPASLYLAVILYTVIDVASVKSKG